MSEGPRADTRSPEAVACASAAVFDDGDRVLLVLRGEQPGKGLWSVPGGRLEAGETALEAVCREIREETGLEAEIVGVCGFYEPVVLAANRDISHPYHITVHYGRCSGEPSAGGDAADARFFPIDACRTLKITADTADWIEKAAKMLSGPAAPVPSP